MIFQRPRRTLLRELGACLSRLINVIAFRGTSDLSTSARVHGEGWTGWERFINGLFRDTNHCMIAWAREVERSEAVVSVARERE